jgi:hypothetical protein
MHYWTKDIIVDPSDATQNTWYVCVFSGWGGAPNGLGGIYRTTNRGQAWTRINDLDRVTSLTFNPNDHTEAYATTETSGLWHSAGMTAAAPVFTRVDSYPFRQPERVYYNPYKPDEIWVASFGNGMRVGIAGGASAINKTSAAAKARFYARCNNGKIFVRIPASNAQALRIAVASIDGKIAYRFSTISPSASGVYILDAPRLVQGVYMLHVEGVGKAKLLIARK